MESMTYITSPARQISFYYHTLTSYHILPWMSSVLRGDSPGSQTCLLITLATQGDPWGVLKSFRNPLTIPDAVDKDHYDLRCFKMLYDVLKGSTLLPQITTEIHNITLFKRGFTLCFTQVRFYTQVIHRLIHRRL